MQLSTVPELLPPPPAPEAVSKTDKSITLRVKVDQNQQQADKKLAFQVSHSEHGYVYYSWTESEPFAGAMYPVKGLAPNTNYVFRARVVDEATKQCSEWSVLTAYIRTFTEEEDAKRAGTYFEHALKLEREQKSVLQKQISKLTVMCVILSCSVTLLHKYLWVFTRCLFAGRMVAIARLDENARVKIDHDRKSTVKIHEDMLSSRRVIDTTISKLQSELSMQSMALQSIKSQRAADEQMITDLLNEQEKLRVAQHSQKDQAKYEQEMALLREQLEKNESALHKHQEQVIASHDQIAAYEASLAKTQEEIKRKEEDVERLMNDCNRMVQEQADIAAVKQLEIEDALMEAKTSLEQQLDINTYLRDEVTRLREENHHLKNQITEMDSEIAPKLFRLEDENEQLRAQLAAYRR